LILTLDLLEVTFVRISGRDLNTHQIRSKSEKKLLVDGRTCVRKDEPTDLSSNL